jgi:hypothetical protein
MRSAALLRDWPAVGMLTKATLVAIQTGFIHSSRRPML